MLNISSDMHKHTLLKVEGTRDLELSEQKFFWVQSGDVAACVMWIWVRW